MKKKKVAPIMRRLKLGRRIVLKEPVSSISHLIGAVVAVFALVILFKFYENPFNNQFMWAFVIYVVAMLAVFLASAVYHGLPSTIQGKKRLNRLDHAMIYVFIAGSFVPIFAVATPKHVGIPILTAVFLIAAAGITIELKGLSKSRKWGSLVYVAMGWVAVFGMPSLSRTLSNDALYGIGLGGFMYTLGAVIYAFKWPNPFPRVFGFHEIFHLFVLAGSAFHFWVIWTKILPLVSG
jgi:hemolysin III